MSEQVRGPGASGRAGDERLRVRRWRRQQFLELGFSPSDAQALAKSGADIAAARELIASGCDLPTVFRIVR